MRAKTELYNSTPAHIFLLKYSKNACGVDFMLNTAESCEKRAWLNISPSYKTDFFELYFFRKASGFVLLNGEKIELHDYMLLIVMPYQQQEWHVNVDDLDYTFLVFQEEFVYEFISDKYFMYRLLYCYQHDYPVGFSMTEDDMKPFTTLLSQIKRELHNPIADSYHIIVAYLLEFLLKLNRYYAAKFNLPLRLPLNNYAFQFKDLLEKNIRQYAQVQDYALLMGISRIALNKAVFNEFGDTRVEFNRPESSIHSQGHCERVLLYALIIGEKICGDDPQALEILAQAAVFHDTRRQDDYLDTGHGARAAVYYQQFCEEHPDITFHPETVYLMRYHDLDDTKGLEAIRKAFGEDSDRVIQLYEIFKDADALDRWRLGSKGLDPKYLRTKPAKGMTDYSRRIVLETIPAEQLNDIEQEVEEIIKQHDYKG